MKIKISMDSACDLRADVVEKHNIGVTRLTIICGDEEFKDGAGFFPEDIFERVEAGGVCTTAAISVGEYNDYFTEWLRDCDALIHFNLSSEISVCYQNALLAVEGRPIHVIDSRSLSSGSGMLALTAAELAEQGLDADEIVEKVRELIPKVDVSFVIDTLKYLHRGGRCSALQVLGANMLKLKPCIEVNEGSMGVGKKYRGSFDTVILQYVKDRLEGRDDIDYRRIFMSHPPGVSSETLSNVRKAILECGPFEDIQDTLAGCTISNHCGSPTLGVIYYKK
ncbi:MAG: DegV family protein [Clostridiales bacterium]|nr:DegV family protein [Clostridiales bacterium]